MLSMKMNWWFCVATIHHLIFSFIVMPSGIQPSRYSLMTLYHSFAVCCLKMAT